jgi:sugar phosphate isomerase/epimerase
MPKRLSFQLYTARNFPLEDTLSLLAKTGYQEVEGYGGVYDKPEALRDLLDRFALAMPSGHLGLDLLEKQPKQALAIARTLGIQQIYAPYFPTEQRPRSAAGWKAFGKRLAKIGAWARDEGFSFGWHNHDFEFMKLANGAVPIDLIFEAAPFIDWECDVAWIVRGRSNPLSWFKRYGERITAVHVKDIAKKGENADEDGWADAGYGVMDWPKLFRALQKSRALHFVVEHDNPNDIARFARRSFAAVSKM